MYTIYRYEPALKVSFPVRDENNNIRSYNDYTYATLITKYLNGFGGSDVYYIATEE
jgi:hypothetical protein